MVSEKASSSAPSPELVPAREAAPGEIQGGDPVQTSAEVAAINRRLAWDRARWGGLRVKTGFFRCPWPCTRRQYEQYRQRAVERWVAQMDKEGWDLKSKVADAVDKRRTATTYSGDWVGGLILDEVEIPVAAIFQKRKVATMRYEVLVASE